MRQNKQYTDGENRYAEQVFASLLERIERIHRESKKWISMNPDIKHYSETIKVQK